MTSPVKGSSVASTLWTGICDFNIRLRYSIDRPRQFQTIGYSADYSTVSGDRHSKCPRVAPRINFGTPLIKRQGCRNGIRGLISAADYRAICSGSAEGQARIRDINHRCCVSCKAQHKDQQDNEQKKPSLHKNTSFRITVQVSTPYHVNAEEGVFLTMFSQLLFFFLPDTLSKLNQVGLVQICNDRELNIDSRIVLLGSLIAYW